jgi:hypothetical protein
VTNSLSVGLARISNNLLDLNGDLLQKGYRCSNRLQEGQGRYWTIRQTGLEFASSNMTDHLCEGRFLTSSNHKKVRTIVSYGVITLTHLIVCQRTCVSAIDPNLDFCYEYGVTARIEDDWRYSMASLAGNSSGGGGDNEVTNE